MQTPTKYTETEKRLNIALQKVKDKLQDFKHQASMIQGNWTDAHRKQFSQWNNWHDLQYRIEQRIWKNYCEYKEWHWNKYQFNTYP